MLNYIKINKGDNVIVALSNLKKNTLVEPDIYLKEDIFSGHKIAIKNIKENENIIKYGSIVGIAKCDIKKGEWIHTHNMKTSLGDILDYKYTPKKIIYEKLEDSFFNGFRRENGDVAIRNQIWIIPTVGCVNAIVNRLSNYYKGNLPKEIDNIISFPHSYGCSQMGEDQENTRKALAAMINHQNAAGVLVVGLGCENSNIDTLKKYIGEINSNRVKFLECQKVEDEFEEGKKLIDELIDYSSKFKREKINVNELVVGLKCGGSDGLSGITANPLVGKFSDILIQKGGSTILTEVPEMFGAEKDLINRSRNKEVFDKSVFLINEFKNYYKEHNQKIYENPSPGNKEGGISTLEDKSNGCIQKSGKCYIEDVLDYGEKINVKGLNLLQAPGNDLVSSTALALSGADLILFTTGRGTPFSSPIPTLKISSNNNLFNKKKNWIDFNAGKIVDGISIDDYSKELFNYVLKIASGEKVKSEIIENFDWAIFKDGVTL